MGVKYVGILREFKRGEKERLYISDRFKTTVAKYPNKPAILFEDRKMSFKELDELSNKIANLLRSTTTLRQGDTMAIFMENCPEYIAIYLALSKLGMTGAFINHNLRDKGLAHCIRVANSSGVFFSSSLAPAVSEILPELDPHIEGMLYSVGGASSLFKAKDLEAMLQGTSAEDPPPLQNKSASGLSKMRYGKWLLHFSI